VYSVNNTRTAYVTSMAGHKKDLEIVGNHTQNSGRLEEALNTTGWGTELNKTHTLCKFEDQGNSGCI
jgi:hypothetical protein